MALKPKLTADEHAALAAELQAEYTAAADGSFFLDIDGDMRGHPSTTGLASALEKERKAVKDAKAALAAFDGVDADEYKQLKADLAAAEAKALAESGDVDAIRADYEAKLKAVQDKAALEVRAAQESATAAETASERWYREQVATAAIAEAKGVPEILLPEVARQIHVARDDNGNFVHEIHDASGVARVKDSAGTPFGISDLVGELRESDVWGRAFDATGKTGSGASSTSAAPAGAKVVRADDMEGFGANIEAIAAGKVIVQ